MGAMPTPSLARTLLDQRESAPDWQPLLDRFVGGLRTLGIGATAPRTGDAFPDFAIPDSTGRLRRLSDLVADGPLVLSFNRGGWCPYCRGELEAWDAELPRVEALGARFAFVTGEVGGRAEALRRMFVGDAVSLCDVDHGLALACGLAFHMGRPMLERYRQIGLDLEGFYGAASGFLPIPATYVIDRGRAVRFAFVDVDFRLRAEPDAVIKVLGTLS